MTKKNRKRLIIIQKGKNKYTASKMQGAAIKMYVIDRYIECEKIKEIAENMAGPYRCYIIGDDIFISKIKKIVNDKKLRWECITKLKTEDDIMREEGAAFPATASEGVKEVKKKTSKIMEAVENLKGDDKPNIDDGDLAAVLMVAEELKFLKIFPQTPENTYNVFIKKANEYILDEDSAKMAVDYYLQKKAKQKR